MNEMAGVFFKEKLFKYILKDNFCIQDHPIFITSDRKGVINNHLA